MVNVDKKADTSGLVTTTVLNNKISEGENKIPNTSSLVTTPVLNTSISEVENKNPDHSKYVPSKEFNKLTWETFGARSQQVDLVNKSEFENKLTSFYKRIISKKAKHLEVQKKLNSLIAKDNNFFLGRIYFTSNGRFQNTFVYLPTLYTVELKKDENNDYVFSCESNWVYNSKLKPLYTAFLHSIKLYEYRIGKKNINIG